jgi:lipoprotein NlpD
LRLLAAVLVVTLAAACSSPPAPVVDRSDGAGRASAEIDGQYLVRRGDTLYTIAFRFGLDHRDLARWNGIRAPFVIFPQQVLRLTPPPRTARSEARTKPPTTSPSTPITRPPAVPGSSGGNTAAKPKPSQPVNQAAPVVVSGDPRSWAWPVEGRLLRGFLSSDPSRNGLDIAGREGDDIRASAAGTVVYSGNGLIGFGELIIIKHSERMLSAYAHNRVRLVQEGEEVSAGQKIAELGRNDRNETILHFEIRVNGRPVDPRKYLPDR